MKRFLTSKLAVILITTLLGSFPALSSESPVAISSPTLKSVSASNSFTGTVSARREAVLSPRLSGLVQIADLEIGDHFEKGETLVQLDTTLAEIGLSLRKTDLALAQAELADAERLLDEAKRLGDSGFPRSDRLSRENDLERAKIRVARAEAELQAQEERIRRHKVVAPFPGTVSEKFAEIGEWVETASPVAGFVGDQLRLEVRVPQEKIREILETISVRIRVQGLPDLSIEGTIDALGPVVDPGTRTFIVRVSIPNTPDVLKPGMAAVASFESKSSEPTLLVPRDAIIRDESGKTLVWIVSETENGWVANPRPVTLGEPRGTDSIILSGLSETDRVVVRGNESLREGQPVRIVESASRPEPAND